MADFLKSKTIKYLNKDFQSFKNDLIQFSQAHHSGVFQDFNETSPGMAILELQAYIGDVLSFYQDTQFEELKQDSARQVSNVVSIAKQHGYRPAGKRASHGPVAFMIEVPAANKFGQSTTPDDLYTPILRAGAKVQGPNGVYFETLDDVYFSASSTDDPRFVTGSQFDNSTGLPTYFAVRKDVEVVAGETKTDVVSIGAFEQFKTIELSNTDVIEVLSVVDSDGENWYEVDYLAQETVFDYTTNTSDDATVVPYVMVLKTVPKRFITDRDPNTNKTSLIFGSGDGVNYDDELIPNIADMSLPLPGRKVFSSFQVDPQNFLKTRSLGLSPFNTTLTVIYRVGGGQETNVPKGTINNVSSAVLDFTSTGLDPAKKGAVVSSIECLNVVKTDGGGPEETISEIKANSAAFFAAQNRVVTREDYIARIMTLPSKLGKPEKVYVAKDDINSFAIDVYLLAKDADGTLTAPSDTLMSNIKTYITPLRMMSDAINLLPGSIVNLGVEFGVVVSPKLNRTEVLTKCLSTLRDYFDTKKMQISQPIVISDVSAKLQEIYGVIAVYKLQFKNIAGMTSDGLTYSTVSFATEPNTRNNILYCPANSIFEVKFPNKDIVGESK